jgi:acyl transferase domain-containing protein
LREPVRFSDVVDLLRRDEVDTCLELGPGEVLTRMIDEYPAADGRAPAVLSLTRDQGALLGS